MKFLIITSCEDDCPFSKCKTNDYGTTIFCNHLYEYVNVGSGISSKCKLKKYTKEEEK